ncbi:penicillin-binding protein 2 [Nesterenkonia sp. LB17]|uniref:peptidoglycan D,D-transpeptidase FtsI family protein n=1 Tax=unclassified Nesterenkonia TaxID=2629769 RepID=UPI001F4D0110|nr:MULTISPECIES: penicillin-binding protein 2 [unclassified Nesterenkonia]MCH8559533.1 penicillin-binding protein 2 [Nesterenkonia sp. DZ6]MCH8561710.1 penicillin-binding protein 2 [Nesterenkonia sp. YGD6]MCH8564775.1 penicillin-binding protein 2 [Nesterenkonia sp. LB17]MCH8570391.1 penicillin-binding protein 2 [Nesterenkonia sp. AY15]
MAAAQKKRAERVLSFRMRIGLTLILVMLLLLGGRLFHVQGLDPAGNAQAAVSERLRSVPLPAHRGDILDTEGRVLAASVNRYDLVVDQAVVEDFERSDEATGLREEISVQAGIAELGEVLDRSTEELTDLIVGESRYSVVARSLTPEQSEQAVDIGLPGLYAEPVSQRSYPSGAVAGSIIGFMGADGPLEGIEAAQDEALSGVDGERIYEVGGDGVRIPVATYEELPAEDGQDVRLTIDQDLQWFAQEAIAKKSNQYNAAWGNATVVDLTTGEILAMADSETVDPAEPGETDELFRRPLALTQDFEPGSTGKAITFAMALEEGTLNPTDGFTVDNRYEVDGQTISDATRHPTLDMTAAGIFARSYNTGTVMIGGEIPEETRYDYMRRVGLGEPLDIGLGTEANSVLRPPEEWDARQHLTTQFGQGYTTSVLHNVQAFQTMTNGGVDVPLRLIDAYVDADGTEHPVQTQPGERIFSEETSAEMLRMFEGVVDYGTGGQAAVSGYRVGGKSGIAEAAGAGGGFDGHTQSFIGMAPLDDPQYLVSVTVHRPQGYWRDWEVTDTFREIMAYVLSSYDEAPSGAESEAYDGFEGENQDQPW